MFSIAALGATILNEVMKLFFQRRRPDAFFGYHQPRTYSFPSGHSIESACFYGMMAAILVVRMRSRGARTAVWAVATILALAVGFSRIYLGVHYPTDVLAGYAAAVIWVGTVYSVYEFLQRRRAGRE
jgi:undecaprenyl-diphosphatase